MRMKVIKISIRILLLCVMVASVQARAEGCYTHTGKRFELSGSMTCEQVQAANEEIDRLEAQIDRLQKEVLSKPKLRFVGSRAKDLDMAMYMENWSKKVEKYGNENYPEAAKGKLYGNVQITAFIKSDGMLEKVQVDNSSGYKDLDNHALDIIKAAAPYAPFSYRLKKKADILGLTRTFEYKKE